jgi:NDP-sugar pyrophosphorylase family protein
MNFTVVFMMAGLNSRFFPLNTDFHKGFSHLMGIPIVEISMREWHKNGVDNFVFVLDEPKGMIIKEYFSSFSKLDVNIDFTVQEEPLGQANAVLTAKDKVGGNDFTFQNPYYIFQEEVIGNILKRLNDGDDGVIVGQYKENIQDYGAFILDGEEIRGYIEKPNEEQLDKVSNYAKKIEIYKSDFMGYLEQEPVHDYANIFAMEKYVKDKKVSLYKLPKDHYIPSLKYSWQLLNIWENLKEKVSHYVEDLGLQLDGEVSNNNFVHNLANIADNVSISGSNVGRGVVVNSGTKLSNSIIMDGAKIGEGCQIKDSIIGPNSHIGDGVIITSNLESGNVTAEVKSKIRDTERQKFGAAVGSNVTVGSGCVIEPGTLIGSNRTFDENTNLSGTISHEL